MRNLRAGALAVVTFLLCPPSLHAQLIVPRPLYGEPPMRPSFEFRSLSFTPVIMLTEFGHDSNVYNRSDDAFPVGDFVSTVAPSVDAWFRLGHLRLAGHSRYDLYYFRSLPDLRAVDSDNAGQVDFLLNRIRLFGQARFIDTQRRESLEIDAIAQRKANSALFGTEIRVGGKTFVDGTLERSTLEYAPNSRYLGTDLGAQLNHKETTATVGVHYAVTPLTRVGLEVQHAEAVFDTASERDSTDLHVEPTVEFSPFALISGRASIGFFTRTFANGSDSFTGTSVLADLHYTLLGRTQFGVRAQRSLEYSYLIGLRDYVLAGLFGNVTQRVGDAWDVGGELGRARLDYRQQPVGPGTTLTPDETVITFGLSAGYNVAHGRIGLYVNRNRRTTDIPTIFRGYERFRIGSTMTYVF